MSSTVATGIGAQSKTAEKDLVAVIEAGVVEYRRLILRKPIRPPRRRRHSIIAEAAIG
jgi:hypothetical protein